MKKSLVFLAVATLSLSPVVNAQGTHDCRCEESFEWLRSTFETNDAGFGYIVERKGEAAYDLHNQIMLEKVKMAQRVSECGPLLYEWLTFFRRGHIGISLLIPDAPAAQNTPQTPAQPTEWETWKGDIAAFEKEMASRQDADFEGVWKILGGDYKIGIKAEGNTYTGFIIESNEDGWKPGQVRMKITRDDDKWRTAYYSRGRNVYESGKPEFIGKNLMRLETAQMLDRVSPVFPSDPQVELYVRSISDDRTPFIETLNPSTLYIRIPSFDQRHKATIEKIIADNFEALTSTENLIIDVRGNGGGSDVSYEQLLPLVYTGPVRTPNVSFLASPANIEGWAAIAAMEELDEDLRTEITRMVDRMRAHPGELVPYRDEEVEVKTFDTVHEYPRNIGIIIDGGCASTTEQFLLAAKQSRKVKLFGITTYGALDASNLLFVDSPDGRYRLIYASSLSGRIPDMAIDDIGLQPDYYLDDEIPVYRWVEYVSEVLNR